MLHSLLASRAPRLTGTGSRTFSAVTHGAFIALAIAFTQPGTGSGVRGRLHEIAVDRVTVTYVSPVSPARFANAVPETVRRARNAVARASAQSTVPHLSLDGASAVSSIDVPDIDLDSKIGSMAKSWVETPDGLTDSSAADGTLASLFGKPAAGGPTVAGAYTPDMVERIVAPAPGNPEPKYPEPLRRMGVEGRFVVRFVVDTTGQVEENQIEFPSTAHRLFVESVRTALLRSRYFPAMLGGRRVAQLVEQEFRFKMVP